MNQGKPALWLMASLAVSGCAGVTKADLAARTDPQARLAPADASPWRLDPGDPVLADLIRRADQGALDVKIALVRAERAQADLMAAQAAQGVTVSAGADAAIGGRTLSDTKRAATPGLGVRYEVDLWGRLRKSREGAGAEAAASAEDVATARLAIAADTARAYAAARAAEAEQAGAARRRDLASGVVAIEQKRLAEGVADGLVVAKAKAAAARAQDRLTWLDEERSLQVARLGDLVGDAHLTLSPGDLPPTPAVLTQAPSDIVDTRPDVRAAIYRLQAADFRRAAAVADARPKFIINALLGSPDATVATLLDTRALAWALAGSVAQELFDGGAKRARIDAATAEADAADLAYRKTVSAAWAEVRLALTAQARAGRELEAAGSEAQNAELAVTAGARRAGEGMLDSLGRASLGDEREAAGAGLIAARTRLLDARIQLALATGGQ